MGDGRITMMWLDGWRFILSGEDEKYGLDISDNIFMTSGWASEYKMIDKDREKNIQGLEEKMEKEESVHEICGQV